MADGDDFGGKLLMNLTKEGPLWTLNVKVMFLWCVWCGRRMCRCLEVYYECLRVCLRGNENSCGINAQTLIQTMTISV